MNAQMQLNLAVSQGDPVGILVQQCCDLMHFVANLCHITYYEANVFLCVGLMSLLPLIYIFIINYNLYKLTSNLFVKIGLIILTTICIGLSIPTAIGLYENDWNVIGSEIVNEAANLNSIYPNLNYGIVMFTRYILAPITQTIWFIINYIVIKHYKNTLKANTISVILFILILLTAVFFISPELIVFDLGFYKFLI